MSIRDLLQPETQDQAWSRLYCQSINANDVNSNGASSFVDITVTGDANIGPNNFQVTNGVGTNGQVLTTNGTGDLIWTTNGSGSGDVVGPVGPIVSGNVVTFNGTTGRIIQDSGVRSVDLALLGESVEFNELKIDSGSLSYTLPPTHGIAYSTVVDVAGDGVLSFAKASLANSMSDVTITGASGAQLLTNNGSGVWINRDQATCITYSFGGVTGGVASYLVANGAWDAIAIAAADYKTRTTNVVTAHVKSVSYSSASGDATTQLEVFGAGVSLGTFLMSGGSGAATMNYNVSSGSSLAIRWTGVGTDPVSLTVQLCLLGY